MQKENIHGITANVSLFKAIPEWRTKHIARYISVNWLRARNRDPPLRTSEWVICVCVSLCLCTVINYRPFSSERVILFTSVCVCVPPSVCTVINYRPFTSERVILFTSVCVCVPVSVLWLIIARSLQSGWYCKHASRCVLLYQTLSKMSSKLCYTFYRERWWVA